MSPAQPTTAGAHARHGRRRGLRAAAAAALATASLGSLAACGEPGPLEGLTDTQRSQLDAAWVARISATDTAAIAVQERNARVTALYKACEGLDASSPLLASVKTSCQPAAIGAKLGAVIAERCATPNASCVRALDRIAQNTEALATATAALSQAATTAIENPECRAELATTEPQLEAFGDLSQAYRVMALGVERKDADITGLGQRRIDDAQALLAPKGRVDERTQRFRQACGLV